jgi:hypothetical protein
MPREAAACASSRTRMGASLWEEKACPDGPMTNIQPKVSLERLVDFSTISNRCTHFFEEMTTRVGIRTCSRLVDMFKITIYRYLTRNIGQGNHKLAVLS